jgi:putative two-component system response regulator
MKLKTELVNESEQEVGATSIEKLNGLSYSDFNHSEILTRIKSFIKSRILNNRLTSIENTLFPLANAVEAKDQYTQGHTSRVAMLAMTLGEELGLGESEIRALRIGGMLHDIGKIGIPECILNKPGPLDSQEWELMKSHSDLGYKICRPLEKNLGLALDVIRYHHEKLDCSGYPEGLPADRISKVVRIMAVVDIFDAMTSDRPFRAALSPAEAFEYLREEAGCQKLDSEVVEYFIQIFRPEKSPSPAVPTFLSPVPACAEKNLS